MSEQRDINARYQVDDTAYDEIVVFEKAEYGEADDDADDQRRFRLFLVISEFIHHITADVVHDYGKDHQKQIYRLSPAVEHETDYKQPDVSYLTREQIIKSDSHDQIEEQEFEG